MSLDSTTCVAHLLRDHPWAAQVLAWHGVRADTLDERWSIATLCLLRGLDEAQLLRDLQAAGFVRDEEAARGVAI